MNFLRNGLAFTTLILMSICAPGAELRKVDPEVRAAFLRSAEVPVVFVLRTQPDRAVIRDARSLFEPVESVQAEVLARNAVARRVDEVCRAERDAFAARLAGLGGTQIQVYRAVSAVAAHVREPALAALEADESVKFIGLDGVLQAQLNVSAIAMGVSAYRDVGITGVGQSIALIDSGVDVTHPAFAGANIVNGPVFSSGWSTPHLDNAGSADDYSPTGHGTAMAGILVGQQGVARGATLYNLKAAYATTSNGVPVVMLPFSALIAALDYAVLQTPAKIVNISYGAGAYSTSSSAAAAMLVDQIADTYDVAVVMGFPNALEPAGAVNAIVVGAMDDHNTTARGDDTIAPTTPSPAVMRFPDVTAPGVKILAPTNRWEGALPDLLEVAGVTTYIGPYAVPSASAAAAHVSGAVALLAQSGITDPLVAKAVLINSADGNGWSQSGGWGYVNLWRAKEPGSNYRGSGHQWLGKAFAGPVDSGALSVTLTTQRDSDALLVISDRKTGKRVFEKYLSSGSVKVNLPNGYYLIQIDDQYSSLNNWALAISRRGFEPVEIGRVGSAMDLKYECYGNANVALGSTFTITCKVTNPWDIEAHNVVGPVITEPESPGGTLCTIDIGTVPGHGTRTQSCTAIATRQGAQQVCAMFRQGGEYHDPDPEYGGSVPWGCYKMAVTGGGYTGKVVVAGSSTSLEGVQVTLSGAVSRVVKTNAKGEFAFYGLPPGTGPYTVTPTKPGYVFVPPSGGAPVLPADRVPTTQSFSAVANTIEAGGLRVIWNSGIPLVFNSGIEKEAITFLSWKGGPNLTSTVYLGSCGLGGNGNVEYFGNAMTPLDPQVGGKVLVGGETDASTSSWSPLGTTGAEVQSVSRNCAPSSAGVPVVTRYTVGRLAGLLEVERTFRLDRAPAPLVFPAGLRPYVPRLRMDLGFTEVLYPATDGTLRSMSALNCNLGCGPVPLARGWFAIHNPLTGQGVVVSRTAANAFAAELWVDWDLGSNSNASSFVLKAPAGNFGQTLLEKQSFLFYDSSTWQPSLVPPL